MNLVVIGDAIFVLLLVTLVNSVSGVYVFMQWIEPDSPPNYHGEVLWVIYTIVTETREYKLFSSCIE